MRERMRMLEFSTFCVNPVGELEELRVTVCVCVCVHMSERTTESAVCVHYSEIYAFCSLVHCALHAHKTTQSRNIAVPHTCAGAHTSSAFNWRAACPILVQNVVTSAWSAAAAAVFIGPVRLYERRG